MTNDLNEGGAGGAGRVNVQIPTADHDDLKTVVFWLPKEFPTLRQATAAAVRQFCRRYMPRALRRQAQVAKRHRAAAIPKRSSCAQANTETQEHATPQT